MIDGLIEHSVTLLFQNQGLSALDNYDDELPSVSVEFHNVDGSSVSDLLEVD